MASPGIGVAEPARASRESFSYRVVGLRRGSGRRDRRWVRTSATRVRLHRRGDGWRWRWPGGTAQLTFASQEEGNTERSGVFRRPGNEVFALLDKTGT